MSSPSTEEEEESTSPVTMSETLDMSFKDSTLNQAMAAMQQSEEVETLLEKKLIYEKTRVNQLRNDNQRLLSQNIDLCRAIRQQKSEMNNLQLRNTKLEEQVGKLFLTVRSLGQRQQENCEKDAELQESLKHEFTVLKDALIERDDQIINLENANKKLACSLDTNTKEIDEKSNKLNQLNNILKQINTKYESEKNKYEQTIASLQYEIDLIKNKNNQLHKLLHEKDVENDTKNKQNQEQTEEISRMKQFENLYQESVERIKENEEKYEDICKELEFWKSQATTLEKECELNMNVVHKLKCELNSNSKSEMNVLKKRYYYLYWKRFVEYVVYEYAREQVYDVCKYLKVKCMKLNPTREICEKQKFKESFKISMFKSLKNVENLDIDELLLCQDTNELTDFLLSSNMSQKVQLKVAAQLLPIVENYRIKLQKDINTKIDNIIKKSDENLI